jgi:hypothetical protein
MIVSNIEPGRAPGAFVLRLHQADGTLIDESLPAAILLAVLGSHAHRRRR